MTPVSNAGGVWTPPHAGLFAQGRTWRYRVTQTGRTNGTIEVTCRVAAVGKFAGGVSSRIVCDQDALDVLVAGIWIETDRGLYMGDEPLPDGAPPDLDDGALMLSATPREETSHNDLDEGGEDSATRRDGSRWCVDSSIYGLSSSQDTWCFDPDGVANGSSADSDDDTENELHFQRDDAPPEQPRP